MTDKEIIKALKCCVADKMICDKCPIQYECVSNPLDAIMARYALDLKREGIQGKMNNLDVAGILRTYSERASKSRNDKQLKEIIRDLKKELDLRKVKGTNE